MERALNEACQRLDLARRAIDEALVRAEQVGYPLLVSSLNGCAFDLEQARAIAEGCSPDPLADDQIALFDP